MKQERPHVAIIASYGLGDALIFLIIANNLVRNGFEVTFYSTHMSQLRRWIAEEIHLEPFPKQYDPETFFAKYDLVLADFVSFLVDQCPDDEKDNLKRKAVFIGMKRVKERYILVDPELLIEEIGGAEKRAKLLPLCLATGSDLSGVGEPAPMVGRVKLFCENILKLQNVTEKNGIYPLSGLVYRKNKKRIIIHPESRSLSKNWWPSKFLKLSKKLKSNGFDPVFITSKDEREKWEKIVDRNYEMPCFENVDMLATYIYESGYMIGNDSGIGHLASCFGIPTVTVTKSTDKNYSWRPGWVSGVVVNAPFKAKLKRKKYFWQFFVSVRKVYNAFLKIYEGQ